MIFQVGIENNNEGRSIAYALEHPGCFAYGMKAQAALTNLEGALNKYAGWILHHEPNTWLTFTEAEIELVVNGTWDVYYVNDDLDIATKATVTAWNHSSHMIGNRSPQLKLSAPWTCSSGAATICSRPCTD